MDNLCRAVLIALFSGTIPLSYSQNPTLIDPTAAECANPGWDARAQVYLPQCSPYALGSYPGNHCFVTIDRAAPTSPQTITLPPGTHVCVALHSPRPTESVQFEPTISNIPAPDLGSSFLPNLSPLQSLGFIAGQVSQVSPHNLLEFEFQIPGLEQQSSFEELAPAQRLEALSVVATPPGAPVQLSAPQMLVVETSDTTNTSDLTAIVEALPAPAQQNLKDASNAVSAAHQLQGLEAAQRKNIADAFTTAIAKAYVSVSPEVQAAALSKATSLSALLNGNSGKVNELTLATELFSLGHTDPLLLTAFKNVAEQSKPTAPPSDIPGTLNPKIDTLDEQVTSATSAIIHAGNLATCFLQYNPVAPAASDPNKSELIRFRGEEGDRSKVVTCSPQLLNLEGDTLRTVLQPIYDDVNVASDIGLLQGSFTKLNTIVTDGLKQCATTDESPLGISPSTPSGGTSTQDQSKVKPPPLPLGACRALAAMNDRLTAIQSRITLLSSLQGPLQQVKMQLERLPKHMDDIIYELPINGRFQRGYTSASVAVVVQPLVSLSSQPTTSTIATVPITYGAGRYRTFTTSTGVAFLLGKAANYSLQQQATASTTGTPTPGTLCSGIATSSGTSTNTYCVVNSPSSSPQIIAPAVYLHYLLFGAKRSPFQVGVHLAGGVGLNLTPANKSAAFMTGASLQLGTVMITPAVTFFEDQRLAGGFTTQQLYTTSGTVPTNIVWPKKFSIGITYVIPALSSASPASPASSPSSSNSSSGSPSSSASGGAGGGGKKPH
ncbi:MAG TPA: hypothetical protein VMI06_05335 [Terriglobia bacterium]|nr:hypothetical protein [Terriglobia bacterium]